MNMIPVVMTSFFKQIFQLSLLLAIVVVSEARAEEYTVYIESLTVFQADEFIDKSWNEELKRWEGSCNSAFFVKVTRPGKTFFQQTLKCNGKRLTAETPLILPINQEVEVDIANMVVEISEQDQRYNDKLSQGNLFKCNSSEPFQIPLNSYIGKPLKIQLTGLSYYYNKEESTSGFTCDEKRPIEVELALYVKPKLLKLSPKFINQIKTYLPQSQWIGFIEEYIRPYTYGDHILFGSKIITRITNKPTFIYKRQQNQIVLPYLTWTDTESRAYLRFPNGQKIDNLLGNEGIALPILKWLKATNGDGLLILATHHQVNKLFRLSELVQYNESIQIE